MKKSLLLGIGAVALIGTVPFITNTPVLAGLQQVGDAIVKAINRPEIKLNLTAAKQVVEKDAKGVEQVSWKQLDDGGIVQPGDVLRYTVSSDNVGDQAAKKLAITQPIPAKTVYQLDSAKSNNGATITYSIDAGQTFVDKPMVKVTLEDGTVKEEPAPAKAYTHVRWQFNKDIDPAVGVKAMYDVKVP